MWGVFLPVLVPAIFEIFKNLNAIYNPAALCEMSIELQQITKMTKGERLHAVGMAGDSRKDENMSYLASETWALWSWVTRTREVW